MFCCGLFSGNQFGADIFNPRRSPFFFALAHEFAIRGVLTCHGDAFLPLAQEAPESEIYFTLVVAGQSMAGLAGLASLVSDTAWPGVPLSGNQA